MHLHNQKQPLPLKFPNKFVAAELKYPISASPIQNNTTSSVKQIRSVSRNKRRLKFNLLSRNPSIRQEKSFSNQKNDLNIYYSSYSNQPTKTLLADTKTSIKHNLIKRQQAKMEKLAEFEQENRSKKQKREFKLIYQLKRQRAKNNEKGDKKEQFHDSKIFEEKISIISDRKGRKEFQNFTDELKSVLDNENDKQLLSNQQQFIHRVAQFDHTQSKIEVEDAIIYSNQQSRLDKMRKTEDYRQPDLNRSYMKAENILKSQKFRESIDISRNSKIREQISLSLGLQSRKDSRMHISIYNELFERKESRAITVGDRIKRHFKILDSMSFFVYNSTKFDTMPDEWEELNFLIYKKYYIERIKVLNFMRKYPMKNPFNLFRAEISSKEVINFMKERDGEELKAQVSNENKLVKAILQTLYNHFEKDKVGEKINLFEYDNFSHWIIEQLWAELILTQYNTSHTSEEVNIRLCRILQLIFLISELNGKYEVSFEEAESAIKQKQYERYIKEGKEIFENYILYKDNKSGDESI